MHIRELCKSFALLSLNLGLIFIVFGVIPSEAVFQAERGISRGVFLRCALDPSARGQERGPSG